MAEKIIVETVRAAENCVRDIKNWLAVFKTEYDIADEAVKVLHEKLDDIGSKMAGIKCTKAGVEAASVQPVANATRDAKNWLAVFAKEYDMSGEALGVLHNKLDELGSKLAAIECK
ncbi:MAG TPA: hypothetical protein VI612_02000 [Candidatus Nanoarchaeia archaeon]|nr:hypothetical protein [Candidatus Nanoarchaeia archaeon]